MLSPFQSDDRHDRSFARRDLHVRIAKLALVGTYLAFVGGMSWVVGLALLRSRVAASTTDAPTSWRAR